MNGLVLLAVGLAGLVLVLAATVVVGLKAWRVVKHARTVTLRVGGSAADLATRAQRMDLNLSQLQANTAVLQHNLRLLQATAERMRVLAEAWREAMSPYRAVRSFLGK
jgi:hypothetical protein